MKYLGIHKIIWFILVVLYTIFQFILLYLIPNICFLIWEFKWKWTWESLIEYNDYTEDIVGEPIPYGDKNVKQTIIRRFKGDIRL